MKTFFDAYGSLVMSEKIKQKEIKDIVINTKTKVTYERGIFLGKGAFGRCYEFKNVQTRRTFAGKVLSKNMLVEPHHKEKKLQEIEIHRSLSHKHIVSLYSSFEDESNMYMILELCRKWSLKEMLKRRKVLTLPEVRYFMRQIVSACKYMHHNNVIHRDLKLGNLLITDNMEIKVGDFGFATRVSHGRERKKTRCGTPNYMAPEVLTKSGHTFKVDIWSIGCIMYYLLTGISPFQANTVQNTYANIKECKYYFPPKLDRSARRLIQKLLNIDPDMRPNTDAILKNDFFTTGYIPSRLTPSCLTIQPKFSNCVPIPGTKDWKLPTTHNNVGVVKLNMTKNRRILS